MMNKSIKVLIFTFVLFVNTLFSPSFSLAQVQKGALGSGGCGKTQVNTAIGCLNVLGGKEAFLGDLLRWSVGVGGGIGFLLIVYAGFMVMTSAGNPERLKAGQELLTSAISGLLLLIFSMVILNIVGIKILDLGKFGFGK